MTDQGTDRQFGANGQRLQGFLAREQSGSFPAHRAKFGTGLALGAMMAAATCGILDAAAEEDQGVDGGESVDQKLEDRELYERGGWYFGAGPARAGEIGPAYSIGGYDRFGKRKTYLVGTDIALEGRRQVARTIESNEKEHLVASVKTLRSWSFNLLLGRSWRLERRKSVEVDIGFLAGWREVYYGCGSAESIQPCRQLGLSHASRDYEWNYGVVALTHGQEISLGARITGESAALLIGKRY